MIVLNNCLLPKCYWCVYNRLEKWLPNAIELIQFSFLDEQKKATISNLFQNVPEYFINDAFDGVATISWFVNHFEAC